MWIVYDKNCAPVFGGVPMNEKYIDWNDNPEDLVPFRSRDTAEDAAKMYRMAMISRSDHRPMTIMTLDEATYQYLLDLVD